MSVFNAILKTVHYSDTQAAYGIQHIVETNLKRLGLEPAGEVDPPERGAPANTVAAVGLIQDWAEKIVRLDSIVDPPDASPDDHPNVKEQIAITKRANANQRIAMKASTELLQKIAGTLRKRLGEPVVETTTTHVPAEPPEAVETAAVTEPVVTATPAVEEPVVAPEEPTTETPLA